MKLRFWRRQQAPVRGQAKKAIEGIRRQERSWNRVTDPIGDSANDKNNLVGGHSFLP
ncbi:hypothetical protein SAMN05444157_3532 [Frankineae bacterium MT45]|nr:hypothetical protein SAMN05444157_3532 [Frankineae bacterium MT45]